MSCNVLRSENDLASFKRRIFQVANVNGFRVVLVGTTSLHTKTLLQPIHDLNLSLEIVVCDDGPVDLNQLVACLGPGGSGGAVPNARLCHVVDVPEAANESTLWSGLLTLNHNDYIPYMDWVNMNTTQDTASVVIPVSNSIPAATSIGSGGEEIVNFAAVGVLSIVRGMNGTLEMCRESRWMGRTTMQTVLELCT